MSLTPLSSVWIVGAVMVGVGLVVVFAFDAPGVARATVAMIVLGVSIVVGFAILDRTRLAPVRRLVAQSQPVDAGRIEPQATTVRHLAVQALVLGTVGLLGLFMEQPAAIGVCWVVAGLGLVVPMRRIRRYELGNGVMFLVEPLSVRLRHWRRLARARSLRRDGVRATARRRRRVPMPRCRGRCRRRVDRGVPAVGAAHRADAPLGPQLVAPARSDPVRQRAGHSGGFRRPPTDAG